MSGIDAQTIASLPESVLKTIPAGQPPPGVQANFVDPPSLATAILGAGSGFLAPALLLYFVRVYTRVFINKKVFWDDFCCTLGFLFAIAYYISIVIGCKNGNIGYHMWDRYVWSLVNSESLAEEYTTTVTNAPALGLIKATLFIQYYTLFWPFRWVKISVWIGGIVSGVFYLAVSIAAFVLNSPRSGESLLDAVLSPRYTTFAKFSIPIGVVGMVVDLYLLFLPIRAVAKLQMKRSKKVGMILLFSTGAFASASSIAGLYYRVKTQQESTDETWIVSYLHIFTQIEMFAGVSCACMPSTYKFLSTNKRLFSPLISAYELSKHSLLRSKADASSPVETRPPTDTTERSSTDFELFKTDVTKSSEDANIP